MGVGAVMLANTSKNFSKGYDRGRGTPVESKTLWNSKGKDKMGIDVENPRAREGQIHCHDGKTNIITILEKRNLQARLGK